MTSRVLRLEVEGQLLQGVLEGPNDPSLPAVVYLHGFGSSASGDKAEYFATQFSDYYLPFCRFDLRGHGESGGDLAAATIERNLADLAAVIADLRRRGWVRFFLVGSSYGALTMLVHAARSPDGIAGIVGVAPAIGIADSIRRREGDDRLEAWRSAGKATLAKGSSLAWSFYEDARRWDPHALARRLGAPSLLFHGTCDEEVDWRGVHGFALDCDSVQLHGFVDGDHRLIEHLPTIWQETHRFLDALMDRAAPATGSVGGNEA